MGLSLDEKKALVAEIGATVAQAGAMVLAEYRSLEVGDITKLRAKARHAGVYLRVLKNTLARRAFASSGMTLPADYLVKSTAVSFAFTDPAATAKALTDATKGKEFVKVKGGFMSGQALNATQVKSLAEMPPLPVMRAQLLGTLQAPAGKLVRTLAEPARGLAAVIKAYADKAPAAA